MNAGRVLIVHPYRHTGGPDTFVTNLVRCLPRGQCWVLVAEERAVAQTLRASGAVVVVEPALRTLPRTVSPIRLAQHLLLLQDVIGSARDLIERNGIRVVHAVHETMWPVLMGLRASSVRRVLSVHGLRFASPAWAGRLNARLMAAAADRIICVSEVVRALLCNWRVPARKLTLVPSSVDLQQFRPDVSGARFREELGIPLCTPLIGTVGSVDERKGLIYFLEACARVHARHPAARFIVVGHDGNGGPAVQVEYMQQLRTRAQELGLNSCLSFVPARPDVPVVMAALDILVQPSLTEAGPRAPLEAMAMQRPVVGTRVEGLAEEVVDGETGILVEPRDGAALAQGIEALLDDPPRRVRMGLAGRARVERFYSLETTAGLIQAAYGDALAEGGK